MFGRICKQMNPSSNWKSDPERRKRIEGDLNLRDTKKKIKELKKLKRTETVADVFDNLPLAIRKLNVETSAWSKCDKCNKQVWAVVSQDTHGKKYCYDCSQLEWNDNGDESVVKYCEFDHRANKSMHFYVILACQGAWTLPPWAGVS